jgi:hypothetical protein
LLFVFILLPGGLWKHYPTLAGLIFDANRQNYTLAVFQSRINNQEAFSNGFRYVYRLKEALHLDLATFEAISYNSTRNYSQNPVLYCQPRAVSVWRASLYKSVIS